MARRGLELTRERAALGLALLVHAALWLGVRTLGTPAERRAPPPTSAHLDEIELDWSEPASEPRASPPAVTGSMTPGAAEPRRPAGTERPRATTLAPPPAIVALGEASPPDVEPAPSPDAVASAEGPIDLGLGPDGWQRWVTPQRPATPRAAPERRVPLVRAPPASTTGGLQEGLEARDQKLGLGPAGRVASALYEAAHHDAAPVTGVARFNVTVLRSGAVEVSLGSASNAGWRVVAERAAEALRKAPPRIPPPRDGYRLTLKITAEETLPNGTRRKDLHGPKLEVDLPRLRSLADEQKELELKNPTLGVGAEQQEIRGSPIVAELPGVYVTERGRVCSYRLGLSPLGPIFQGGCDVGAKLQRIVRTEVEKQSAF